MRHADAGEQEDDVGVFGRGFVGADEQVERVGHFRLAKINFGEQVLRFGRVGAEFQRAIEREFGVGVFAIVDVGLREREEDAERVGLERVGFFEFELSGLVLVVGREHDAELRMKLGVGFLLCGECVGEAESFGVVVGVEGFAYGCDLIGGGGELGRGWGARRLRRFARHRTQRACRGRQRRRGERDRPHTAVDFATLNNKKESQSQTIPQGRDPRNLPGSILLEFDIPCHEVSTRRKVRGARRRPFVRACHGGHRQW